MVRPRSTRAHDKVIQAALSLFAERGLDATSMDAIAERSGVSKATIYKHWADKESLALEAMTRLHVPDLESLVVKSGDLRADLIAVLGYQPALRYSDLKTRIMPHLMAYAARNPSFGLAWRARVIEPPRAQLRSLLAQAQRDGLLSPALEIDVAIALLLGPMMYTHMTKLMGASLPANMAERVVDAFWTAYAQAAQAAEAVEAPPPRSGRVRVKRQGRASRSIHARR
jgi:AcrR family transcriptional regulator